MSLSTSSPASQPSASSAASTGPSGAALRAHAVQRGAWAQSGFDTLVQTDAQAGQAAPLPSASRSAAARNAKDNAGSADKDAAKDAAAASPAADRGASAAAAPAPTPAPTPAPIPTSTSTSTPANTPPPANPATASVAAGAGSGAGTVPADALTEPQPQPQPQPPPPRATTAVPAGPTTPPPPGAPGASPLGLAALGTAVGPTQGASDDAAGDEVEQAAAADPKGAAAGAAAGGVQTGASAAQPLLYALNGAGATVVKAENVRSAPSLRSVAASKGKIAATGPDDPAAAPLTKTATLADPAPTQPLAAAVVVADDGRQADADEGDGADPDTSSATPDGASLGLGAGLVPAGFDGSASSASTPAPGAPMSPAAADLAAQMAAKVSTGASRFQLQLNPLGLGQVDVTVSIGADRQLTAALAFSDAHTASVLSAHAGELKSALEQAGFSVPQGGFDFASGAGAAGSSPQAGGFDLGAGGSGFAGQGHGSGDQSGWGASAAFSAGEILSASGAAAAYASSGDSRLDIRI
jgi:Meckel syndrome type 1 protein